MRTGRTLKPTPLPTQPGDIERIISRRKSPDTAREVAGGRWVGRLDRVFFITLAITSDQLILYLSLRAAQGHELRLRNDYA